MACFKESVWTAEERVVWTADRLKRNKQINKREERERGSKSCALCIVRCLLIVLLCYAAYACKVSGSQPEPSAEQLPIPLFLLRYCFRNARPGHC